MRTRYYLHYYLRGVPGCDVFCALGGGCCAWLAKLLVEGLTRICVTCVGALGPRGDLGGGKFCAAVRCGTGGVFPAELVGVSSIKSFNATQLTAPKRHVLTTRDKTFHSKIRTCVAWIMAHCFTLTQVPQSCHLIWRSYVWQSEFSARTNKAKLNYFYLWPSRLSRRWMHNPRPIACDLSVSCPRRNWTGFERSKFSQLNLPTPWRAICIRH